MCSIPRRRTVMPRPGPSGVAWLVADSDGSGPSVAVTTLVPSGTGSPFVGCHRLIDGRRLGLRSVRGLSLSGRGTARVTAGVRPEVMLPCGLLDPAVVPACVRPGWGGAARGGGTSCRVWGAAHSCDVRRMTGDALDGVVDGRRVAAMASPGVEQVGQRLAAAGRLEAIDETSCWLSAGSNSPQTLGVWLSLLGHDFAVEDSPEFVYHLRVVGHRYRRAWRPGPRTNPRRPPCLSAYVIVGSPRPSRCSPRLNRISDTVSVVQTS